MAEMQISPFLKLSQSVISVSILKKYPGSVEVGSIRGEERKEDFDFFFFFLWYLR